MRPRPDAAENLSGGTALGFPFDLASMRPRPDAAENPYSPATSVAASALDQASMRPRPDAAENGGGLHLPGPGRLGLQ